jgi:hypothetical protein
MPLAAKRLQRSSSRRVPLLVAAMAFGGLAGCAGTAPVLAEQAPGAEVSAYASFAFYEPMALEREGYGTAAGERARAVLRREMEAKGYRLDPERPALRLNVVPAPAEAPRNTRPRLSLGLGTGFGSGRVSGGVGVGIPLGGGSRDASRLPGALAVDVVDVAAKRVVWTGSVELPRVGRAAEGEALQAALERVMVAMPRQGEQR